MKKALAIVAIVAGAVCYATTLILGVVYMQDIVNSFRKFKNKYNQRNALLEEDEF